MYIARNFSIRDSISDGASRSWLGVDGSEVWVEVSVDVWVSLWDSVLLTGVFAFERSSFCFSHEGSAST